MAATVPPGGLGAQHADAAPDDHVDDAHVPLPSLGETQSTPDTFGGELPVAAVTPSPPAAAVAAIEPQAPSSPMLSRGAGSSSAHASSPLTASSSAAMTTPRPASEAAIAQWLEDIGLADTPGLLDALARGAGSLNALRTMPDEAISAAVSPLQLRSLKQRKLNAALIALRSPTMATLESPASPPADEPPSRPKKPAPVAPHAGQARVGSRSALASGPALTVPAGGAGGHESAELSDLAHLLAAKGGVQDSKRDSNVAELAKAKAASAAEEERRMRQEAAKDAALGRARAAARRTAAAAIADTEPLTMRSSMSEAMKLAMSEAAAEAARSPPTAFTPRTALAVDEMLARDLQAALDAAASGVAPMPVLPPALPTVSEDEEADDTPQFTPRTSSQLAMATALAAASTSSVAGSAPQFTARTIAARAIASQGGSSAASPGASMAPPASTPAATAASESTAAAASTAAVGGADAMTPRSRALVDDMLAHDLALREQEAASAAVVASTLAAAASASTTKAKPKKLKGAKKLKSAQFSVDIGDTQLSTTLDAKWLAKPLRDALVMPAIDGYLSGKHLSGVTSCTATEVVTTLNGEVVDCSATALSFAQSVPPGEVVRIVLILPERVNAAVANQAASANADANGESLGGSKAFVVDIVHNTIKSGDGSGDAYSMTTELNSRWLAKPFWEGLVTPAMRAYAKSKVDAESVPSVEMIKITIDGKVVDGSRPVSEAVPAGQGTTQRPIHVRLMLPDTVAVQPRASLGEALMGAVSHEPAPPTMPTLTVLRNGKGRRSGAA